MNNNTELQWVHERSALVELMLQDGFNHILCEVSYCDKDFNKFDGNVMVILCLTDDGFLDYDGNLWGAVQPLLPNGNVMGYNDYLKMKQSLMK